MSLPTEIIGWGEFSHAELTTNLLARYQQLREIITVLKPFDPGGVSAPVSSVGAPGGADRCRNFHVKIWG